MDILRERIGQGKLTAWNDKGSAWSMLDLLDPLCIIAPLLFYWNYYFWYVYYLEEGDEDRESMVG